MKALDYIKEEKGKSLKQLNIYKPSEISLFFLVRCIKKDLSRIDQASIEVFLVHHLTFKYIDSSVILLYNIYEGELL